MHSFKAFKTDCDFILDELQNWKARRNMNIIEMGLNAQKLIADANNVTDAEVKNIQDKGLRLVHRPHQLKVVTEIQRKRILETKPWPPEAA